MDTPKATILARIHANAPSNREYLTAMESMTCDGGVKVDILKQIA